MRRKEHRSWRSATTTGLDPARHAGRDRDHALSLPRPRIVNLWSFAPLFIPLVMSGLAILICSHLQSRRAGGTPVRRARGADGALHHPDGVTSMAGFDWNQEMAARNLGASPSAPSSRSCCRRSCPA